MVCFLLVFQAESDCKSHPHSEIVVANVLDEDRLSRMISDPVQSLPPSALRNMAQQLEGRGSKINQVRKFLLSRLQNSSPNGNTSRHVVHDEDKNLVDSKDVDDGSNFGKILDSDNNNLVIDEKEAKDDEEEESDIDIGGPEFEQGTAASRLRSASPEIQNGIQDCRDGDDDKDNRLLALCLLRKKSNCAKKDVVDGCVLQVNGTKVKAEAGESPVIQDTAVNMSAASGTKDSMNARSETRCISGKPDNYRLPLPQTFQGYYSKPTVHGVVLNPGVPSRENILSLPASMEMTVPASSSTVVLETPTSTVFVPSTNSISTAASLAQGPLLNVNLGPRHGAAIKGLSTFAALQTPTTNLGHQTDIQVLLFKCDSLYFI